MFKINVRISWVCNIRLSPTISMATSHQVQVQLTMTIRGQLSIDVVDSRSRRRDHLLNRSIKFPSNIRHSPTRKTKITMRAVVMVWICLLKAVIKQTCVTYKARVAFLPNLLTRWIYKWQKERHQTMIRDSRMLRIATRIWIQMDKMSWHHSLTNHWTSLLRVLAQNHQFRSKSKEKSDKWPHN